jgi:hypothetical protein
VIRRRFGSASPSPLPFSFLGLLYTRKKSLRQTQRILRRRERCLEHICLDLDFEFNARWQVDTSQSLRPAQRSLLRYERCLQNHRLSESTNHGAEHIRTSHRQVRMLAVGTHRSPTTETQGLLEASISSASSASHGATRTNLLIAAPLKMNGKRP